MEGFQSWTSCWEVFTPPLLMLVLHQSVCLSRVTKRDGHLWVPTSGCFRGLQPLAKACFSLWTKSFNAFILLNPLSKIWYSFGAVLSILYFNLLCEGPIRMGDGVIFIKIQKKPKKLLLIIFDLKHLSNTFRKMAESE